MLKIAHRGYSHKYIDNSIDAFIGAIEEGFDMIETDIQLCKNNDIVVFHDNMINNKEIIDMTLLELEELGIISLKTFFNLIDTLYIEVYLDLKGTIQLANMLIEFIYNNDDIIYLPNISIASFNRNMLHIIKNSGLCVKLGYITSSNYTDQEWCLLTHIVDFVSMSAEQLNHETIHYLHTLNKYIFAYTCRNMNGLKYIKQFDIDGIVSNIVIE